MKKSKLVCLFPLNSGKANQQYPRFNLSASSVTFQNNQSVTVNSDTFVLFEHFSENIVHRLVVVLVGSEEVPDLSEYAETVNFVEFCGHISYVKTAFRMISQLKNVHTVKFTLGRKEHLPFLLEDKDSEPIPIITSVTSLHLYVELELYNSKYDDVENSLKLRDIVSNLVKKISDLSVRCFPNLTTLDISFPGEGTYLDIAKKFLKAFKELKNNFTVDANDYVIKVVRRQTPPAPPPPAILNVINAQVLKNIHTAKARENKNVPTLPVPIQGQILIDPLPGLGEAGWAKIREVFAKDTSRFSNNKIQNSRDNKPELKNYSSSESIMSMHSTKSSDSGSSGYNSSTATTEIFESSKQSINSVFEPPKAKKPRDSTYDTLMPPLPFEKFEQMFERRNADKSQRDGIEGDRRSNRPVTNRNYF